jgi:hypothetical protein
VSKCARIALGTVVFYGGMAEVVVSEFTGGGRQCWAIVLNCCTQLKTMQNNVKKVINLRPQTVIPLE